MNTELHTSAAERRKVVAATIIGTTIEWYDFFIYAFAANLVFAPLFFAPAGEGVGIILSLLTIGLSFLFRPLGAFLAGHFGDRIGRRPMLVLTLLLMGAATTLVGVLPTYQTAGLFAPIALILLRILQGISAGGEWGGAVLMSVEHAPQGRRARYGVFPQLGVPLGMIVASAVLAVMRAIAPGDAFLAWGWRIPFFVSILLVIVGYLVRRTVDESPVFREIAAAREQESAPVKEVFRRHWPLILLSAMLFAGNNANGYMTTGGFIQGLSSRPAAEGGYGFDPVGVQLAILGAAAVWFCSTLLSGWLADRFGRKITFMIGWIALGITVIPLFELVKLGVPGIFVGASLMSIGLGLTYGPQAVYYAETFPASVRFSGVSISYAIGAVVGGAFAASIAQALLQKFGTTWAIVPYLLLMVVIGIIGTALLPERRDIPLGIEFEQSGRWQDWRPETTNQEPITGQETAG